jgi:hypothetical protein
MYGVIAALSSLIGIPFLAACITLSRRGPSLPMLKKANKYGKVQDWNTNADHLLEGQDEEEEHVRNPPVTSAVLTGKVPTTIAPAPAPAPEPVQRDVERQAKLAQKSREMREQRTRMEAAAPKLAFTSVPVAAAAELMRVGEAAFKLEDAYTG